MKIFGRTAFLILFFASFANASEVLLNNEKIDIQSSSATVIRTNQTPETVEISFLVPMENSICERYETRMVLRTSGVECGYDVYTRTISTGRTCIRSNPQGHCQKWADTYRTETVRRPRTCMVPETFCAQYGTATTFDHVTPTGAHRGGIIAPGINLSLDALGAAAAKLPRIAIEAPADDNVIGRTTEGQMLIGVYWGYVAMIEGLITRMKRQIADPVTVVATGGLAVLFQQHAHLFDAVDGDLTLRGLALLYARRDGRV